MSKVKTRTRNRVNVGLIIALCITGALLAIFATLFAIQYSSASGYANNLEQIYQKNMYELVDNVNNTEIKLSKVLSAQNDSYRAKLLKEISYNTDMAQNNLNNLPYSMNGVNESISFVNQVSGYTETLSNNLEKGNSLSAKDEETLDKIYDNVLAMKSSLSKFSKNMYDKNVNLLNSSKQMDGEHNVLTKKLGIIKQADIEYPTMIYDGPFSDSVVNKKIEGLANAKVDEGTAKQNLLKCFSNFSDDEVEYKGDTNGKFETFNYIAKNSQGKQIAYIQMTKQGGKLLTASSYTDKKGETISMANAKETALNFVKKNGVKSAEVVWSDKIGGNAYINIAPVVNDIIYYPDLIKVKIDLSNGNILGYEACAYYTNHKDRNLATPSISKISAKNKIAKKFSVENSRLALIPLEYNQEILTYEFVCKYSNDEYYFYYDVEDGELVNVLKVIKTDNGSLLM